MRTLTEIDPVTRRITDLPAIDLTTLSEQGALLTRQDRKYLVDVALLPHVVDQLATAAAALEIEGRRQLTYESVYYDTPSLVSYLQATRRRPRRFKVRSRTYVDSASSFLEVKTRDGRGRTVKERIELPGRAEPDGPELHQTERAFVASRLDRTVQAPETVAEVLTPTVRTRYRRATLFLPLDGARVTVDVDLQAQDRHGAGLVLPGMAIVETKTVGRPCAADRVLWRLGQRPMKVSKYATSLAALHPRLPATKWLPALRRLGLAGPASGGPLDAMTSAHASDPRACATP